MNIRACGYEWWCCRTSWFPASPGGPGSRGAGAGAGAAAAAAAAVVTTASFNGLSGSKIRGYSRGLRYCVCKCYRLYRRFSFFFFWLSFALRSSEIARGFRKVSFHGCFICLKKWSKISNKVHCSLMERNLAEYGSDRSVWKENVYFHIFVSNVAFYYSNVWCQVCQQSI